MVALDDNESEQTVAYVREIQKFGVAFPVFDRSGKLIKKCKLSIVLQTW